MPGIPRNRTGKRLEIPLKRLVAAGTGGVIDASVLDPSVLVDPDSLAETVDLIRRALP